MTFEEATQYLFSSFPSFEKSGKTGINEGLRITRELLEVLGNPQHSLRCIHIAGTNGKGSSSHFLASILQEAGYKTGLFTSPHVKSFTERIRINGAEIAQQQVIDFITAHQDVLQTLKPSFFEITTAMAFDYFKQENVDIAIIETGLGGRLDSTNVLENPLVCLITNIGLDHVEMLGNTLVEIAAEKAGIIKAQRPVVLSEGDPTYRNVIADKAESLHAPLSIASERWSSHYEGWEKGSGVFKLSDLEKKTSYRLQTPLGGAYQGRNLCGVLEVCRQLQKQGYTIQEKHLIDGIQNVIANTQMKGRWQTLSTQPLTVCDAVHNLAGWEQVLEQLTRMPQACGVMVLGFSSDKKPEQFIARIPAHTQVVFSGFANKRASDPQALLRIALDRQLDAYACTEVNEALDLAKRLLPEGSFIFVGGSIYLLSELNNI